MLASGVACGVPYIWPQGAALPVEQLSHISGTKSLAARRTIHTLCALFVGTAIVRRTATSWADCAVGVLVPGIHGWGAQ